MNEQMAGALDSMSPEHDAELPPANLEDKVREFVDADETSIEFARECLWRLMDRTRDLQRAMKRDSVGLAIAALVFELINRGLISEASGIGVKLAELAFLKFWLPPLFAYLFLRLMFILVERDLYHKVYWELARQKFPGLSTSGMDDLMVPSANPIGYAVPDNYVTPRTSRITSLAENIQSVMLVFILPIGFTAYSSIQLIKNSGVNSYAAWASALTTVLLVAVAYLILYLSDVNY